MTSLSFTQFLCLPRWHSKAPLVRTVEFMLVRDHRLQSRWVLAARPRKAIEASDEQDGTIEEQKVATKIGTKKTTARGRKKGTTKSEDDDSGSRESAPILEQKSSNQEASIEGSEKPKRKYTRKAVSPSSMEAGETEKESKKGRKNKKDVTEEDSQGSKEDFEYVTSVEKNPRKGRKGKNEVTEEDNQASKEEFEYVDDVEKKPRKGRKGKNEVNEEDDQSSDEVVLYVAGVEKKPRRGRKSKNEVTEEDNQASKEEFEYVDDVEKKPRRGTKGKNEVNEEYDQASDKEVVYVAGVEKKPRRGRKGKSEVNQENDQGSKEEAVYVAGVEKKPRRGRKSKNEVTEEDNQENEEEFEYVADVEKKIRRGRRSKNKVNEEDDQASKEEVVYVPKKSRRGRKSKKEVNEEDTQASSEEVSDTEGVLYGGVVESEDDDDLESILAKAEEEDISFTYGWPPLVCCFGAAQCGFVPSGKPSNRLLNYEIHDGLKERLWEPEQLFRSPGGSADYVALALQSLGGRVAFMGKLGKDGWGQSLLYNLNVNNIQTRSVCLDEKRLTALSTMKIAKRGKLRAIDVKPCAEDSLSKSEINIDVLKEAKMFYLNTSSLLNRNMRKTALQALKISKKLGGVIFYDVNLPLPLWQSAEETKSFIQQIWQLADVVEVTKQELEFLCGIKASDEYNTRNNNRAKFNHYDPEFIAPLWHENLKVLFVTNGTSMIHYYTKENHGSVRGMEDAPLTPFTQDMSASGDGIVAAIMKMITVQPNLITDKEYLKQTVQYAINCGVREQWIVARQRDFPPRDYVEYEQTIPDMNGFRSITEKEFCTLRPVEESMPVEELMDVEELLPVEELI